MKHASGQPIFKTGSISFGNFAILEMHSSARKCQGELSGHDSELWLAPQQVGEIMQMYSAMEPFNCCLDGQRENFNCNFDLFYGQRTCES